MTATMCCTPKIISLWWIHTQAVWLHLSGNLLDTTSHALTHHRTTVFLQRSHQHRNESRDHSYGMAPRYLADLCCSTSAAEIGHNLRSATNGDLRVRRMCTKFGDRAFYVAGPRASNKLSIDIRSCDFVESFERKLKRHLFGIAYGL